MEAPGSQGVLGQLAVALCCVWGNELWGVVELGQSRTPLAPALKPQGWPFLSGIIQQERRRGNFIKGRETTQTSLSTE